MDALSLDEGPLLRRALMLESLGLGIIPAMLLVPAVAAADAPRSRKDNRAAQEGSWQRYDLRLLEEYLR